MVHGLGLRNLVLWNMTCMNKPLWLLMFTYESVSVSWIQDNVIKDESFWSLKPRQNHTWIFKQILAERQTAIQWLQIDPGNGYNVSFWNDPWTWTRFGKLTSLSFIGQNGPRQTGIPLSSSVADVWRDGVWIMQSARSPEMEELLIYLATITLNDSPSTPHWIVNGRAHRSFVSSVIYPSLMKPAPLVPWYSLI